MQRIWQWSARAALAAAVTVTGFSMAGCDRSLFGQDDKEVQNKLSYFPDGTSAHADREARRENQQIGFGYPSGPSGQ